VTAYQCTPGSHDCRERPTGSIKMRWLLIQFDGPRRPPHGQWCRPRGPSLGAAQDASREHGTLGDVGLTTGRVAARGIGSVGGGLEILGAVVGGSGACEPGPPPLRIARSWQDRRWASRLPTAKMSCVMSTPTPGMVGIGLELTICLTIIYHARPLAVELEPGVGTIVPSPVSRILEVAPEKARTPLCRPALRGTEGVSRWMRRKR
jgi:hypothetical protein